MSCMVTVLDRDVLVLEVGVLILVLEPTVLLTSLVPDNENNLTGTLNSGLSTSLSIPNRLRVMCCRTSAISSSYSF
jgi:hypothetical protein